MSHRGIFNKTHHLFIAGPTFLIAHLLPPHDRAFSLVALQVYMSAVLSAVLLALALVAVSTLDG